MGISAYLILLAVGVPSACILLWLNAGILWLTGWTDLAVKFPNRAEEPLLQLRWQSGCFGTVNVSWLTLSVCPSGLRVAIPRLLGPFCHDFFVPWENLTVIRKKGLFEQDAELRFPNQRYSSLTIAGRVADKLASASQGRWPKSVPLPLAT